MEPPDVVYLFLVQHKNSIDPWSFGSAAQSKYRSLRVRGGMPYNNPNIRSGEYRIEYLENIKFIWDGIPTPEFRDKILPLINMGLGTTSMDGWSLLSTAERRDAGGTGPFATPPYATASQTIKEQHDKRKERLFCSLMNYIKPTSQVYLIMLREFNYDGVIAYEFVLQVGYITFPQRQIQVMEHSWNDLTFDSAKIKRNPKGLFIWAHIVKEQGRILKKSNKDIKDKILQGLPEFMSAWKAQFQSNTKLTPDFGANYSFPYPPSMFTTAHPKAGQPDIDKMIRTLWPHFYTEIVTKNFVDKGIYAYSVWDPEWFDEAEQANLAVSNVTPDTKCFYCGGDGHAATQTTEDGEIIVCASKRIQLDRKNQSGSLVPGKIEERHSKPNKKVKKQEFHKLLKAMLSLDETDKGSSSTMVDYGDESEDVANETTDNETENDSDTSAASEIADMAEIAAFASRLKKGKKPILKKTKK